jgi:hypothetical protein
LRNADYTEIVHHLVPHGLFQLSCVRKYVSFPPLKAISKSRKSLTRE